MTPEQEQKLNEVYDFIQLLKSGATIPYEAGEAMRDRLGLDQIPIVKTSTKGVDTEDKAVNEAGSASYNVLKEPDGFLEIALNGTTYYIPYYG